MEEGIDLSHGGLPQNPGVRVGPFLGEQGSADLVELVIAYTAGVDILAEPRPL